MKDEGRMGWLERAACASAEDKSLWECEQLFGKGAVRKMRQREQKAKAVCAGCPVKDDCLYYGISVALDLGLVDHIYGGLTPGEQAVLLGMRLKHASGLQQFRDLAALQGS